MYPYLTAGSTFRDSRDSCFGHYRAAVCSICGCHAADPSGHRTGGRAYHRCSALFLVRGQAGAYLDRGLREICGRRKEAEALFPKSAACAHRSIYTDRRSIISGGICKPGRAGMVHTKNNRVRGACGVRSGSRCGGEDPESDLPSAGLFYPGPGDDAWNFSVRHLRRTGSHRIMYSRLLSVRPV